MRNFKFILFSFLLFFSFSCQKDVIPNSKDPANVLNQYKWSEQEKFFFNLNREEEVTQTRTRTVRDFVYHPLLIESYNELARQNEGQGFVNSLIAKIGYPLWNKTIIRDNQGSASDLILIPFTPSNGTSTSGILVSYKKDNLIKYDIVTRSEFLQSNNVVNCFKMSYLNEIKKFDNEIFGFQDQRIKKAYCDCTEQELAGPIQPNPTSSGPCPWGLIELCTDGENDSWIGGLCKTPPHLDHDLDCIPNDQDQDFYELTIRYNFTQSDWEQRVRDYFNDHYDIDYDDFINDPDQMDDFFEDVYADDDGPTSGGINWEALQDWLLDWAFDPDHDDIWNWDDHDDDGNGISDNVEGDCPWNPIVDNKTDNRTVTCETYYTRICEGQGNSLQWFDIIGDLIPCPGCTDQDLDAQDQALSWNLTNYINDNYNGNQLLQTSLWPIVQDCPALGSPEIIYACFDQVILQNQQLLLPVAWETHERLGYYYQDYEFSPIGQMSQSEFNAYVESIGASKYLATASLYEALNQPGFALDAYDTETMMFYWEMFEQQLLPLGITFIPYGVGDAADILQSCGSGASWSCTFAMLGLLVPFDEMADIWRKSDEIKAAWRVVKNFSALKAAWKFAENCPKLIRTNPAVLDGIRIALQRTLQNLGDIVSHANVSYIDNSTISHIFRGSNNGGVHHISALLADPSTYKIHNRIPTSNGCYKATIYKNGVPMTPAKDFFPDDWDELQVVDAIKGAYSNATKLPGNNNHWVGIYNGLQIMIYKANDGRIISSFPYNP